jgi:hypothetical protein
MIAPAQSSSRGVRWRSRSVAKALLGLGIELERAADAVLPPAGLRRPSVARRAGVGLRIDAMALGLQRPLAYADLTRGMPCLV